MEEADLPGLSRAHCLWIGYATPYERRPNWSAYLAGEKRERRPRVVERVPMRSAAVSLKVVVLKLLLGEGDGDMVLCFAVCLAGICDLLGVCDGRGRAR